MRYVTLIIVICTSLPGWSQKITQVVKDIHPGKDVLKSLQKGISVSAIEAGYDFVTDGTAFDNDRNSLYGNIYISSQWSIASVPFEIAINNQTWIDYSNNNLSFASVHFDRDIYLEQLKNKMSGGLGKDAIMAKIGSVSVADLKKNAIGSLKVDMDKINERYDGSLGDVIDNLGGSDALFSMDVVTLREKLSKTGNGIPDNSRDNMLNELINRKNVGLPVDPKQLKSLESTASREHGLQLLMSKIIEHRSKWQSSGLLRAIGNAELFNRQQLDAVLKNPQALSRLVRHHFRMTGFQKFFLKVNKLNLGQNTLNQSKLSANHLINNGVNSDFLNNNRYLMFGLGKLKVFNSILDQGYEGALDGLNGAMRMGSFGLGKGGSSNSRISVMSFDQSMNQFGNMALQSMRSALVTTFSNQMIIGRHGILSTEISRSSSAYQNTYQSDSTLGEKSAVGQFLNTDNFWNNMAFSFRYDDELEDYDLSYGILIGKTANGYVNPASAFLASGSKNLGLKLKKAFLKQRLSISARTDLREYDYSEDHSRKWINQYSVFDIAWRLGRGESIGLRYLPNKMTRSEDGVKSTATSLERFSLEGSVSRKLFGVYYRNNLSLSTQAYSFMLGTGMASSRSIGFSSFQNIVVHRQLFYWNFNYDYVKNNSSLLFLNSSLVAEAGTSYMVLSKLSLSSALCYNSMINWYRQIGVRQTVSGQLGERFNMSVFVDMRKTLRLLQPIYVSPIRADISLHYLIKK
jgi:hypothetical protein